jgi:hypothetical protein
MIVKPPHEKILALQAKVEVLKRMWLIGPRSVATLDALGIATVELCTFIHKQQLSN